LPAGVIGVKGAFASGMAVKICVRRRKAEKAVEENEGDQEMVRTEPNTPALNAIGSISSSISTLDGMLGGRLVSLTGDGEEDGQDEITPSASLRALPEDDQVLLLASSKTHEEWEIEEVGRGLANYNSAQIERVKGMKSSYIAQVLGYADSEYVVENITIRVPP